MISTFMISTVAEQADGSVSDGPPDSGSVELALADGRALQAADLSRTGPVHNVRPSASLDLVTKSKKASSTVVSNIWIRETAEKTETWQATPIWRGIELIVSLPLSGMIRLRLRQIPV